jgi:WD40 repeat protein
MQIISQQTIPLIALPNLVSNYLARSSQGGILSVSRIFQAQLLWRQPAHEGKEISSLAWSYDGELLASSGEDGMIRIWQAATGRCLSFCQQADVMRLQFSSTGTLAAACEGGIIRLLPMAAFMQAAAA